MSGKERERKRVRKKESERGRGREREKERARERENKRERERERNNRKERFFIPRYRLDCNVQGATLHSFLCPKETSTSVTFPQSVITRSNFVFGHLGASS